MKKITKEVQPAELTTWREENAEAPQNLSYGLASFPTKAVLNALMIEQGYVCAYTLLRVDDQSAHVEHLKPQTQCKGDDKERENSNQPLLREDIAWSNMVACIPAPNTTVKPPYGATKKDKWWHVTDFLSPLDVSCEERFEFKADGKMLAKSEDDLAAKRTIEEIGLNDEKLQELRKSAFVRAGIHRRSKEPITSIAKISQLIAKWSKKNQITLTCEEFCVPMVQVAKEHAEFLRKRGYKA
ncbi:MAG: hypothetical protein Q7K57_04920 [Burkholderiaceae bacterium]|nr:hypothetical protein [Burkholderiaceae bacterium]